MQSTNSEYGSPYLVVCHVTVTFTFTVRQGSGRLKMFLNLKRIFAPFAFVLFYYLINCFKYKTLFTIHSVVIEIIFLGGTTLG